MIKCRAQRAHPALDLVTKGGGEPADDGTGLETIDDLKLDDDATLLFEKYDVAEALKVGISIAS